jgi:uncharacterized protein (TIGR02246 family)
MTEQLEARMQRLEDLVEINQLFVDYIEYLDAGDAEAYAGLFAEEGEIVLGPATRAKGHAAIVELITKVVEGKVGNAFHIVSSPRIQLDGDNARCQVMWTVIEKDEAGKPSVTLMGRHFDRLVRENGAWRFLKRTGRLDIPSFPRG